MPIGGQFYSTIYNYLYGGSGKDKLDGGPGRDKIKKSGYDKPGKKDLARIQGAIFNGLTPLLKQFLFDLSKTKKSEDFRLL